MCDQSPPSSRKESPMQRFVVRIRLFLVFAALLLPGLEGIQSSPQAVPGPALPPAMVGARLPLAFEPNMGQSAPAVQFLARTTGGVFFFTPTEVVMSLDSGAAAATGSPDAISGLRGDAPSRAGRHAAPVTPAVVRLRWIGANTAPDLQADTALPGTVNYFVGSNPAHWQTNLPTYADLNYRDLYSGVDLAYSGAGGRLKSTYVVAPGADPGQIRWQYECGMCRP